MPRGPEEGVAPDGRRYVHPTTRAQWRAWLGRHVDDGAGVWLVSWKKATGKPSVGYEDAVLEAVAHGWIDSTGGSLDPERGMLWMSPRKKGSGWSRSNKQRVELLTAQGLMTPAGQRAVDQAHRDGTWSMLDEVENMVVPDDLRAALDADPVAATTWDGFPRSVRRAHLEWVRQAKRDATRAARIATIVAEAHDGRRANQPRQPGGGEPSGRPR